jgi:hypothetical protein
MTVRCGCAPVPHARPHSTRNTITSRGSFSCPCPRSRNPRMGTAAKLIVHQRLFPSSTCTTRKVARPFSMACPSLLRGVIKEGSFPTATMEGPNRAKGGGTVLWRLRDISAPFSQHVKQVVPATIHTTGGKTSLSLWPARVATSRFRFGDRQCGRQTVTAAFADACTVGHRMSPSAAIR